MWWAEGAERVSARARERWNEQAGAQRAAARQRPAATSDTAAQRLRTTPRHLVAEERRASKREDLVTGWCSLLLVLGLYLDGWSHGERAGGGLTLWHGVLYLGFAGTAAWILTRNQRRGAWSLRAVPAGYRLALVGVGLAMVAVAGDTVWHTLFGASQGLGQLVSPFHLVLFAGACLLVSSALRAAWSGPSPARVPGLRAFWPVVLSTTLVVAMTAFFFQHVSPVAAAGPPAGAPSGETAQVYELTGLLAHNFLFLAPVLLLLLRWQTPLGTFTVMAGSVALLLATQTGLGLVGLAGAAVLGGAAADAAVTLLRPSPQRRWAARTVAVVAPAVYWTSHFALLGAGYGVPLGAGALARVGGLGVPVRAHPGPADVAAGGAPDRLEPGPGGHPENRDADGNARANGREVTSMTATATNETAASMHERFEATALPLHDSIYRANLRMTGDPVMAQDLTQETYLRAFRAFDSFEAGTNCRAWMLQISHNLFCRDYRGRKRITYRTAADDDVDVLAQFRADVPNPEEEALRQLDREALRRAISKLPEPYRVAVTLVELQGLSCEEAAAVMGTPKGTVLSRLFRARERLRRLLLSEFGRSRTLVPSSAQNS